MTRAKHDRLVSALIAKLPTELPTERAASMPWPRAERIAWLRMMALAFDVVYGPCGGVRIGPEADEPARASDEDWTAAALLPPTDAAPAGTPLRFFVDHDGFAMGAFDDGAGERPIAMEDLPAGATLWDERTGIECGDATAILWRDIGTTRRTLPLGVTLRSAFEAS